MILSFSKFVRASFAVACISTIFMYCFSSGSPATPVQYRYGSGEMFDKIASYYDFGNLLISGGMHMNWKRDLLASMNLTGNSSLLDLATGTGDVAWIAVTEFNLVNVSGIDPSKQMISLARSKSTSSDLSHSPVFSIGDAENLSHIVEGSIDAVSISFGIRNFENRPAALREIYRVLARGGTLGILELTPPRSNIIGIFAGWFTRTIVPVLGLIIGGSTAEYLYLQDSVFKFPQHFENDIAKSGLHVTQISEYLGGIIKIFIAKK